MSSSYIYNSAESEALACRGARLCLEPGKGPCMLQAVLSILTVCPSCQAWWPLLQTLLEPCYIMSELSKCHKLGQQC